MQDLNKVIYQLCKGNGNANVLTTAFIKNNSIFVTLHHLIHDSFPQLNPMLFVIAAMVFLSTKQLHLCCSRS